MVGKKGHEVIKNIPPPNVIRGILNSPRTLVEKLLVYGLLFTGMRIGELVHMRREWIRWDLNKIFIPYRQACSCRHCIKARYRKDRKTGAKKLVKPERTWEAKSESARRSVPIPRELKPLLREYFSKHEAVMEAISYREIAWYMLKRIAKRAKIDWKLFPHLLRGAYASKLASQGVNVYRLKEVMGWKKIDVAAEYVKLYGPTKEEEVIKWRFAE